MYVSKNVFTNHIFNIYVKTGFGIKYMICHKTKPKQTNLCICEDQTSARDFQQSQE